MCSANGHPDHASGNTDTSLPVTVAITRRSDPARTTEMVAWMRAGATLAEDFPGFLGVGWVRPNLGSEMWHMLYRFADEESLRAWEESSQRQWWLNSMRGIIKDTRTERRTGIEGWFDPPRERSVEDIAPPAPPRWKQAVIIWLPFFPLNLLFTLTAGRLLTPAPVAVRALVSTLILTPVMTYLAMPRITRALDWWLRGQPAPWRRGPR